MDRELLLELLRTPTVSGCEEAGQRRALEAARSWAEVQRTDAVGNAFSLRGAEKPFRVLLCGHMDEIGFRVTHITEDGFLRVQKAGGVRPGLYVGSMMQVMHERWSEQGPIYETVPAAVVVTEALTKKEKVEDSDLLLDIGASSREEAAAAVSVGDGVCADTQPKTLLNDRLCSRALDDKAGAFVVLEAAKLAAEQGADCGVLCQTSVGEETTGRGAYLGGAALEPDCAIVVDVTWASDCPGTDPGDTGSVKLGAGPVLCRSGMVNKAMNALLEDTARELGIPLQYEVAGFRTGTDGDTLLRTGRGIPMALVSIPLRYMHSSVELAAWSDLEQCIRLIAGFLRRIGEGFDFRPIR